MPDKPTRKRDVVKECRRLRLALSDLLALLDRPALSHTWSVSAEDSATIEAARRLLEPPSGQKLQAIDR